MLRNVDFNAVNSVYTGHVYTGISLYRTDSRAPFVSYENPLFIPEIYYKLFIYRIRKIFEDHLVLAQITN